MNDHTYWESLFANHKYPCYIRDVETEQLLYVNHLFLDRFSCDQSIIGRKFNEVVIIDDQTYKDIQISLKNKNNYEFDFYHNRTNQNYHAIVTLMRDQRHLFCELEVLEDRDAEHTFVEAMTRCMEIYRQPAHTTVLSFMELLTKHYDADRAYVYRINREDKTINCISQWSSDPKYRLIQEVGTKMNATSLIDWIQTQNEAGVVMGDRDQEDLSPTVLKILETFQIQNLTLCTIEDSNHDVVGVVGLSNRANFRSYFDGRLINTIARFVAQEVTKCIVDATLFQLHHCDTLTGLANRAGFVKKIEEIMETQPKTMGAISANINGLRNINEIVGIAGGDELVKASAKRLRDHFSFEIYRMSGDEFLGVCPDVDEERFMDEVTALHEKMREEQVYDFSLGHAWVKGSIDLHKLQLEAETVMYINKQEYYSSTNRQCDRVSDTILSDLLAALENDEFMVYLQPQVVLEDSSLYGAEALIRRYDKKNEKMVFPDQFIPLYEQKSVIRHVDMFVLETVCKLLQEWMSENKQIPVSVNFSRVTLQEYGIVETITKVCDKYQVPHNLVVIEVTERVGLIENNVPSTLIQQFKDNGFHISLDDFGCAYSNIVTLAQIEVDEVKIDKSLVDFIMTSKKNRVLVKNVLAMCHELEGASTLAEGIEDEEQAQMLKNLGCQFGQGYFYSRPIPTDEFVEKYIK